MTSPTAPNLDNNEDALAQVLETLVERGALTAQALERGRRAAEESGERQDRALNKLGLVTDGALVDAWSSVTGLKIAGTGDFPEQAILKETLSAAFLSHAQTIPLRITEEVLHLAVLDPCDSFSPVAIATKTGLKILCYLARPGDFAIAFSRLYGTPEEDTDLNEGVDIGSGLYLDVERLRDLASDAPVIRIANRLIDHAIESKASDLHISGTRNGLRVRYRIDGVMQDAEAPPAHLHSAIVSRLKIMAGLDIAERRLPQDGRIRVPWRGREIDLRISTMPHINGEGIVLRVLDRANVTLDFTALGFSARVIESLRKILTLPHGLFLVTGPTGSGKTTTLYTALQEIASPELNVITVEDPVEYQLEGVNQIQISRKIGLDFAQALRAVLRQDPDVIMVGEIRDEETAAVANQAALTGHLVLATLHTNNAVAALPRLVDMGIEPYLLASTFRASMAQRLARRLCPSCSYPQPLDPSIRDIWGARLKSDHTFGARGCSACSGTGHRGRVALSEFLPSTESVRRNLLSRGDEESLAQEARAAGYETMLEDGLSKVSEGSIGLQELLRVLGAV